MKRLSIKKQLILFLALFGLFLWLKDKERAFFSATAIALGSAVAVESLALYLKDKRFSVSESSAITGLIISFVLANDNHWWVIVLTSAFAISSKYLIRFNKRHIFNPAGFGIILATLFLGAQTQWKGTYAWFILLPAGLYFIHKIRKLELLFSYFAASLVFFGAQALMHKGSIFATFGYFSYFFIFIMLIEPKTTPFKFWPKLIFGFGVATTIFIFTQSGASFDVEIAGLLALNLIVPILSKIPEGRKI